MTTIVDVAAKLDLNQIIAYLEATTDDQWTTDVCRTKDGSQNCLVGHLHNYFGGDDPVEDGQLRPSGGIGCDWFEEMFATVYMIYPVNDGLDPAYPQASSRDRCIAYLKDLRDGKTPTTHALMELWE